MKRSRREELIALMMEATCAETNTEERLKNVQRIEDFVIRDTFGEENAERLGLTLDDVLHFYRHYVEREELTLRPKVSRLADAIDALDHERRNLEHFQAKYSEFQTILNRYAKKHGAEVLWEQRLCNEKECRTVKTILVTGWYVMIIVFRVPYHSVNIDKKGIYSWYSAYEGQIIQYNLLESMEEREYLVWSILRKANIPYFPMILTVVWDSNGEVFNYNDKLQCVKLEQLDSWLNAMEGHEYLSLEMLEKAVAALKNAKANTPPHQAYYMSDMIEAYADLKSAVEWEAKQDAFRKER